MEGREDEIVTDTCCVLQRNEKKEMGLRIMKAVLQQTSNRKSSIFSLKAVLKPGDWKKKRLELVLEALMRAPPLGLEVQVRLIQKLLLTAGLAEGSCVIL